MSDQDNQENKDFAQVLAEFEQECSKDTHPESSGFFSRVREFFDGLGGSS